MQVHDCRFTTKPNEDTFVTFVAHSDPFNWIPLLHQQNAVFDNWVSCCLLYYGIRAILLCYVICRTAEVVLIAVIVANKAFMVQLQNPRQIPLSGVIRFIISYTVINITTCLQNVEWVKYSISWNWQALGKASWESWALFTVVFFFLISTNSQSLHSPSLCNL